MSRAFVHGAFGGAAGAVLGGVGRNYHHNFQ
jgi:hypothetical protein